MSITNYTIGSVKTFRGHDGNGFSCMLLKNKKKVAEVVDDGWGGGYQFHWFDTNTSALVNTRSYDDKPHSFNGTVEESLFYAEVMKLPKLPAADYLPEMFTSPDIVVGDMVNEILLAKDVTKNLKKNFTIKCPDDKFLTWKISTSYTFDKLKLYAEKNHPNSIVVNELPINEVIKMYKEANLI